MKILQCALFVASGFLTFQLYSWGEHNSYADKLFTEVWYSLRPGLPFGLASAALWARPVQWIPLIAFLDCLAWCAAYWVALVLTSRVGGYAAMAIAGCVGASAVALFTSLGCRSLKSRHALAGAAIAGAVAGIPFGIFPTGGTPNEDVLVWAFPLWQLVVGIWMYTKASENAHPKTLASRQ